MTRWIALTIAVTACAGKPVADHTICECDPQHGCVDGKGLDLHFGDVPCDEWTTSFCEDHDSYACKSGCAVESLTAEGADIDPQVFCAETPAAQVGDSCADGCLPTRATVDATGAVTQTYLACDSTYQCAAAPPPTVADWLAPCPVAAARWGAPGVNGRASAYEDGGDFCLLAWDAASGTVANGLTIVCLGDWDCPAGAMCDDHVTHLEQTDDEVQAVCRPGARGTPIDPARLHP